MHIAIIGGGAAGIFAAIAAAETYPLHHVTVFEATREPLDKVRISGGGRCNVTHHCFDPAELVTNYPRGHKELRGPFARFQPRDTVQFFAQRDVQLKAESDGRMFPTTDNSGTIIDCLLLATRKLGVKIRLGARMKSVTRNTGDSSGFSLHLHSGDSVACDRLMIATGSGPQGYRLAESLGHTIVPCVPSLFTFKIKDARLRELAGISFESVRLELDTGGKKKLSQTGPMLITHWGLSGPAVLKLSAWGARELHSCRYKADLRVNFVPDCSPDEIAEMLSAFKNKHPKKHVMAQAPFDIPRRYWSRAVAAASIEETTLWADLPKSALESLRDQLTSADFAITGKGIFKDEFVTAGGVSLKEVDFRTMQSRVCPGLYFGGEILDIDGVTGGFNFQSAWTTGHIAGESMGG